MAGQTRAKPIDRLKPVSEALNALKIKHEYVPGKHVVVPVVHEDHLDDLSNVLFSSATDKKGEKKQNWFRDQFNDWLGERKLEYQLYDVEVMDFRPRAYYFSTGKDSAHTLSIVSDKDVLNAHAHGVLGLKDPVYNGKPLAGSTKEALRALIAHDLKKHGEFSVSRFGRIIITAPKGRSTDAESSAIARSHSKAYSPRKPF
ncbi:hypothetical protein HUU53_04600 [Candidatus Micrarchaeota archaeon]|nr:hypothetical protein [Candidatus Micrarchaeota archaeon]